MPVFCSNAEMSWSAVCRCWPLYSVMVFGPVAGLPQADSDAPAGEEGSRRGDGARYPLHAAAPAPGHSLFMCAAAAATARVAVALLPLLAKNRA